MKRLHIFPKIFIYTFSMMIVIVIVAHFLIFLIAPYQNMLITNTSITSVKNIGPLFFSEVDMNQLILDTIKRSFPISLFLCALISLIFSFFFTKVITSPILYIAKVTQEMADLNVNARCNVFSSDEFGILALNINDLYCKLISTIKNLEMEKQNVKIVEQEKLDFMRAASHELKTPLTELNVTLENMILEIEGYSDYQIYLPKCKSITEQLAKMVKDILDASRLQFDNSLGSVTKINLKEFITNICEPYKLIAQSKDIKFNLFLDENIEVYLPPVALKKVISNILLNAVSYTEAKKAIFVKLNGNTLFIENECVPLSADQLRNIFKPFNRAGNDYTQNTTGNGLGLYITSTILSKLDIKYSFSKTDRDSMCFSLYFKT